MVGSTSRSSSRYRAQFGRSSRQIAFSVSWSRFAAYARGRAYGGSGATGLRDDSEAWVAKISNAQRYAVFTTHGDKCYLCHGLVTMLTFEVDHVIPESLLQEPARLAEVLTLLGRPADFDLNSYENWLPSCRPCNGRKRATVFDATPIVQVLVQLATERAPLAREHETRAVHARELGAALNVLLRQAEAGELTDEVKAQLHPLVVDYSPHRSPDSDPTVVHLTRPMPPLWSYSRTTGWCR